MANVDERIRSLASDLELIPERQERMAWVVDQAKRVAPLPAADRTEHHRVPGCVSAVWMHGVLREGRLHLRADADSPLVRGLVLFVVSAYQEATPAEILASTLDPLAEADLSRDLSPTRQNGLAAVRAQIRRWAEAA